MNLKGNLKVHVFPARAKASELTTNVNAWLSLNHVIIDDIKYSTTRQAGVGPAHSAMIIYFEKLNKSG